MTLEDRERTKPGRPWPSAALGLSALLLACGPGSLTGEAGSTSEDSATKDDSTDASTSAATSTSTDTGDTSGTTETGPAPACGDGIVEGDEQCDEGPNNAWEQAPCQPDCTPNECGDGYVGLDEDCDPGTGEPGSCTTGCEPAPIPCGSYVFECGDLEDNDGDGRTDLEDLDCLSPCDDSEDVYQTSLPGDWICKIDCQFDTNNGAGDDTCEHNLRCDPLNPGQDFNCPYDPNFNNCDQQIGPNCLEVCLPIVANGCDCFGCCELAGAYRYIGKGSTCGSADPSQCSLCTPNLDCFNECDGPGCELCFSQTLDELAPGCAEPSCPEGVAACVEPFGCAEGEFCQTGCCRMIHPW